MVNGIRSITNVGLKFCWVPSNKAVAILQVVRGTFPEIANMHWNVPFVHLRSYVYGNNLQNP